MKENKIKQNKTIKNPFLQEKKNIINNYDAILGSSKTEKVKNVNITLYESDILKMKFITQTTGAKLSTFVRKCINEEYRKHNKKINKQSSTEVEWVNDKEMNLKNSENSEKGSK